MEALLRKRIRYLLWFFVVALLASGLTAFPLRWESSILARWIGPGTFMEALWPALAHWIGYVDQGIHKVHLEYPFLFDGTDWLAFAHIGIAVAFWGPLKDPVKHLWVIEWGMILCVLVIPLALICGQIRGIPFFWRLADCSFGVFGVLPLWVAREAVQRLAPDSGVTAPRWASAPRDA